ncbi:putative disease resistance protein RGA3 [Oryza sativa Japonica Group]|uniref:NBS-LRR protein n=2 Tax=Oryza sativa subsp. japonica TaxID=39947 RepID=B9FHU0_ORYSJ|nr:putative NBS-LRR resistance protein [Oryza sativa Japonica Group]AAU43949.1 putative NBS-LRR protein [Oryza sativa Japonica Group]EEE63538.1 hypothetical protein OsJ_18354 [Oryza sativa Japonica Group]KAF2930532.1 hypothetical protein DAI22_05g143400 [Oryza sativa Japonica Group]BAS93754.1 Os05g0379700 [Oryza sativa Japonica Group]
MAELLSALLPALLKKAGESLGTEFSFIGGIERRRSELYTLLLAVNQVINDAEDQASKKPAVKSWIAKLKLAACDADDALDELHYEELRCEALRRGHKINTGVRAFFSSHYNPLLFKYRIGKRLQQIVERIDQLVSQMNRFGFLNCSMPVDERMQTYSYVDEQEVIGRDKERDEIVHMLLSAETDELLILPIVGIGGLGKTTLAQLVFNDVKVKAHFQKHMWVCVSENFSVPVIVKGIIDTAIGNDCGLKFDNLELLQQRLREELGQKRYLLVLDDVWNEDKQKWGALRTLLGSCGMGSAVVVTTRNVKVASIMESISPLCLENLNPEDSWIVFSRRAFGTGVVETPELVEVGKRIVEKCCGLPLAIKSMGALMSTKQETRDWLSILESNTWDEESQILPALSLGYKNLPSHMKQCFAFCAVFPKDYEIDKDDLIHLWVSNGFIPSKKMSDIEENGNHVFWELVWRSFFQNVKQIGSIFQRKVYRYGQSDVTTFKIHDLMHDLAVHISGDECLALENLAKIKKIPKNVHHMAFEGQQKIGFLMQHCRVIRSVFALDKNDMHIAQDIKFNESPLRVVGLHIFGIEKFPVEPAFMKHLRYLDLSGSYINTLPEAASALYNLQVLILNRCRRLTHLPDGMKFMISLRHVYLDDCARLTSMPAGLGQLINLRTLTKFVPGNESGYRINELNDLKLGGKLQIFNLIKVTNPIEAKEANLECKTNLQQLALCWGTSKSAELQAEDLHLYRHEEVLDALKPPNGLTVLKLRQYMGTTFPIWMENGITLRNIVKLKVTDSINCMKLPSVWKLPFLEVLRLKDMKKLKYLCNGFCSDKECDHQLVAFPKLKLLSLERMESLENWQEYDVEQVTPANFPVLDAMEIIDCPKLTAMPNAPVLKSLSVIGNKILIGLSSSVSNLSYLYLGASQGSLERKKTLIYHYKENLEGTTDSKDHVLAHHFSSWGSLTKLHLQGFSALAPEDIQNISGHVMSVQNLDLISCDCFIQYDTLQSPLWFWKSFACLQHLTIEYCNSLTFWPGEEFQSLTSLKRLDIRYCNNFTGMPPAQVSVKSFEDEGMHNLERIEIEFCYNLVAFPTSLSYLRICSCNVLEDLPEGLGCLGALRSLSIDYNPRLKSLPPSIQRLSNLTRLYLGTNDSLTTLPEGMHNLTALNDLAIWNCPSLKALPEGLQQRLHSLEKLFIRQCPTLVRRCKRGGDYWSKVKDIPDLRVTGD